MKKLKINQYIENYKVVKFLGRGKSAYSYLVEKDNLFFVYKQMHQEEIDYYHFDDKLEHELEAYHILKESHLKIPKLISYNKEQQYLIKAYIDGPTLAEYISKGQFDIDAYLTLYAHAMILENQGINIDYFPTNFIVKDGEIIYIDYEINTYQQSWDFIHWGSLFLFHQKGFLQYLKDFKDTSLLLDDEGLPLYEPIKEQHDALIKLTKLLPIIDIIKILEKIENNPVISKISTINSGFAAKVFKIETENKTYIYKAYDDLSIIDSIQLEIKAYDQPNKYMPKMYEHGAYDGFIWMLFEYIDGQKTMDIYQKRSEQILIDVFTDVFIDIHQEKNDQTSYDFIKEEIKQIEDINAKLKDRSVTQVLKVLKDKISSIKSFKLSRIHGDYHPWNTIHKDDSIYVIDWMYRYGDFRYDVMWTYALLYRSGFEGFANSFLYRYQQSHEILNLDFFLTLANLRWFVNVKLSLKEHHQHDLYDIIKYQSEKLNELNPYFVEKILSFE